ncbi:MAG: GGDEF domain-containing protein [Rubrivivax sp.]
MTDTPPARRKALASLTTRALEQQVAGLRAELASLQLELAAARIGLEGSRGAQLREANEHLVLSALRAQEIADTAVRDLHKLTRSSQRDALTGTPNRELMRDRLDQAIALARRHGALTAVLFIDLDDFKTINDTLGHGAGDEVLQLTARRLEAVVRESDTVSRHGGDEFLVLLAEVQQPADAQTIATKMLAALSEPCVVRTKTLRLSASIGIALYPDDGAHAATLIGHADAAMYRVKRRGGDGFERYDEVGVTDHSAVAGS